MEAKTIAAHAVRPGMRVFIAGTELSVEANLFDRHGKGPYQALTILVTNTQPQGNGYGQGEHYGLLPSTPVTVLSVPGLV